MDHEHPDGPVDPVTPGRPTHLAWRSLSKATVQHGCGPGMFAEYLIPGTPPSLPGNTLPPAENSALTPPWAWLTQTQTPAHCSVTCYSLAVLVGVDARFFTFMAAAQHPSKQFSGRTFSMGLHEDTHVKAIKSGLIQFTVSHNRQAKLLWTSHTLLFFAFFLCMFITVSFPGLVSRGREFFLFLPRPTFEVKFARDATLLYHSLLHTCSWQPKTEEI